MKTIVVLAALAAVALAAPSTPGDRTSSLRSWPREKKSPTFGKLKGHHETEYHHHHHEPEYHHHHVPQHHLALHPVPVHHGYGHGHHLFREDEKATEDTKTTCAKEVAAKCGQKEAASEKEALILTSNEEKQMRMIEEHERTLDTGIHTNIQAARLALDKMQQNLEEMERSAASPKLQWKHADSKTDLSLHADIESARSALANVQKNIDELHNINEDTVASVALREADIETSEFEKMTEEERMAQWKEAIETIERNVEIADNIKKSFASDSRKTINDHQKSVMMKESEIMDSHQDKNNKGKEMEMSASETSEVSMKTVEHKPTLSLKPESLVSKLTEERTSISPAIKSDKIDTEAIDTEAKLPLAKSSEITKEESTLVHNDGNLHLIKEKEAEVVAEKKLDDTLDHTTLARENTKHLQLMKVKDAELKENEDAKLLNDQHKTSNLPREDVSIDFLRSHNDEHIAHIEKKDEIHNMNHGSTTLARENIASEKKGSTKNIKNNEAHNDMEHHESKTNIIAMKAAVADETPSKVNVQATLSNTDKIENTQAILPHGKNAEVASMHGLSLDHEMKHTKLSEDLKPLSMKAASSDVPHGRFADDMDMSMNMKAASSGMAPTHEMTPIKNRQKQELNRNIDFHQRATGMSSFDHFHGHADQMKAEPAEKLRSLSEKSSGGWRKHESSRNAYGPSVAAAPAGYGGGASGGAVGVFPNAHVSNCAVPLLLSCSPNVVSGHLAKAHHAGYGSSAGGYGGSSHAAAAVSSGGYGAPAHAAPAGYGAPAAHAAPAGYGAPAPALAPAPLSYSPYRSSEDLTDFNFHNKRDVKKMASKVRRSQKALSRNY